MRAWCYRHPNAVCAAFIALLVIFVAVFALEDYYGDGRPPWISWEYALRLFIWCYIAHYIRVWWRRT